MELSEIQQLLGSDFKELKRKIEGSREKSKWLKEYSGQYDSKKHKVHSEVWRPKKEIKDDDGVTFEDVNRLSVPLQKLIVRRAVGFLCGNPIRVESKPADEQQKALLEIIAKVWDDNKLDFQTGTLARRMMSECECAEIWYWEDADEDYWAGTKNEKAKFRLRMRIASPALGDDLYPVWNANGDMVAFAHAYITSAENSRKVKHWDLYLAQGIYRFKEDTSKSGYVLEGDKVKPNPLKKIPVIYYQQERPEWWDVQDLIERLETLISNHADTNDYNGSPIVLVHGEIESFSEKGERGKILELTQGATAEYLTWQSAPESVKMEVENLIGMIFDYTDTPNISFDKLQGLGNYSFIALTVMFMAAHQKSREHEENFGEGIQRRLNLLAAFVRESNVDFEQAVRKLKIKPKFEYYIPKDPVEKITLLNAAVSGGTLSIQSAVEQSPLVSDAEEEMKRLDAEENKRIENEIRKLGPIGV